MLPQGCSQNALPLLALGQGVSEQSLHPVAVAAHAVALTGQPEKLTQQLLRQWTRQLLVSLPWNLSAAAEAPPESTLQLAE